MFELESMTKAKLLDVRVLAKKDRKPGEDAGAQLLLSAQLPADILTCFDGSIKGILYCSGETAKQKQLDGVDYALALTTVAEHVKRMRWEYAQTGCSVEIDHGIGGKRNLRLADCTVHRVTIKPEPGGSVELQWSIDAPALSDETRGKITGMKATEIQLTIEGPDPDASAE